jgi:hypothetical protein
VSWQKYLPLLSYHNGKVYPLITYSFLDRWFLPAVAPIMIGAAFSYLEFNRERNLGKLFAGRYLFLAIAFGFVFIACLYANAILWHWI